LHIIIEHLNTGVETLAFKQQKENFVQYWQFVTECTGPWMVHRSIHGALWRSIDSNCAIFCFHTSNVPWKLKLRKLVQ